MYTKFLEQAKLIVAKHRAQYHGEYVMFSGGGSSGSTTTTQQSSPWAGQQPYLTQTMQQAQNLYNNPSDYPQYYPNSTVQPFNNMETGAINDLYNTGTQGSSALNSANSALTNFNDGAYASAGNPYFQQMAQSVASTVTPQLESQFTQGNAMNNPAAAYATSQGLGSALAPIAYQNYSDQMDNMLKSAALSPTQYQAQLTGDTTALGAGQTQQTQDQNQLSDQVNRYTYNQELPYEMLNQYANTINGNYGSSSSLTQPYYSNSLSNALSGATSLLGANALTGGSGGGFGSTLLGGLGSFIFG